jgi:hypothetical protein
LYLGGIFVALGREDMRNFDAKQADCRGAASLFCSQKIHSFSVSFFEKQTIISIERRKNLRKCQEGDMI